MYGYDKGKNKNIFTSFSSHYLLNYLIFIYLLQFPAINARFCCLCALLTSSPIKCLME